MPLVIERFHEIDGDSYGPLVFCDFCGELIRSGEDGNVTWRVDATGHLADGGIMFFTHKGCVRAFEADQGPHWYTMGLSEFPVYLVDTLEIDWRAARRRAEYLDRA